MATSNDAKRKRLNDIANIEDLNEYSDALISDALQFESDQRRTREQNQLELSLDCMQFLIALRILKSVLRRESVSHEGIGAKGKGRFGERFSLIAAYIQGMVLCEEAILGGLYVQAAALLKQELETIAALEENCVGNRAIGKTPNVKSVKSKLAVTYGPLNIVSHLDQKVINAYTKMEDPENQWAISLLPIPRLKSTEYCLALHLAISLQLVDNFDRLLHEAFGLGIGADNAELIEAITRILCEKGYLTDSNFGLQI